MTGFFFVDGDQHLEILVVQTPAANVTEVVNEQVKTDVSRPCSVL